VTRHTTPGLLIALTLAVTAPSLHAQDVSAPLLRVADLFPATLDWQPIEGGGRSLETRYGTLSTGPGKRCVPTGEPITYVEVLLNERPIGTLGCTPSGDYYLNFFRNRIELGGTDVVILSSDAGGSGSPPPRLHLILIRPDAPPRIEADPSFRSIDGTQQFAYKGTELWFDLGYVDGRRRFGVFDGGSLRISEQAVVPEPLQAEICERTHASLNACVSQGRMVDRDYTEYSLARFLGEISRAAARPIEELMHNPGFNQEAYMRVCASSAKTGVVPDYTIFAASVCTP